MRTTISIPPVLVYGDIEPQADMEVDRQVAQVLLVIAEMAHRYPGGLPALAARVGMSPNTLQHKVNVDNTTHNLTVIELAKLRHACADTTVANAMAEFEGYICRPVRSATPVSLLDGLTQFMGDSAGFIRSIRDALESGRPVTRQQQRCTTHYLGEVLGSANALARLVLGTGEDA